MAQLAEDEIFDEIESFFLENYSNQLEEVSGSGISYDINVFRQLRKFIILLNDKYHTGLGVMDGQYKLKNLSNSQIEEVFYEATKNKMSYQDINKNLQLFIFFLNELKYENQQIFEDLSKKCRKFTKFLNSLHQSEMGKRQSGLINDVQQKFGEFNDILEFFMQQSTGFVQRKEGDDSDLDSNDDQSDLRNKLRLLTKIMNKITLVKKQGFPQLVSKYIDLLKTKQFHHKNWNKVAKLISLFPLHLQSNKLNPNELYDFIVDISSYVLFEAQDDVKEQLIQKIKMLFQKVENKKMDGGQPSRIVTDEMMKQYKKKLIIDIFKYNIQGFYSEILSKFNQIIQQKYISQLNLVSGNLKAVTNDLKQVFQLLVEGEYLNQELREFIDIIKKDEQYDRSLNQENGLRLKFQYMKQEIDNIINDAKQSTSESKNQFSQEFIQAIRDISTSFQNLINYIKTLEKKNFDVTEQDIKSFERENQQFDMVDMNIKLNEMMDTIDTFINVSHMYQNIERTKKELDTIDLSKYQDESIKVFIKSKNDMTKYYKELIQMYTNENTKFNPTLALYLKNILLKFHSCEYINRGISKSNIINPRYECDQMNYDGTDRALRSDQIIGITEDLGAKQFKNKNRYQLLVDVFKNGEKHEQMLPKLPDSLSLLQTGLGEEQLNTQNYYKPLIEYPYLFDIMMPIPGRTLRDQYLNQELNKEQLRRLFNSEYETQMIYSPQKHVIDPDIEKPQMTQRLNYIDQVVEAYAKKDKYKDRYDDKQEKVVTCFDNDTLTELLNPQIQIPYIQPFLKLKQLELELKISKDAPVQQIQISTISNQEFTKEYKEHELLTSMIGFQTSIPMLYTPKGVFGHKLDMDNLTRFNLLLKQTNRLLWCDYLSLPLDSPLQNQSLGFLPNNVFVPIDGDCSIIDEHGYNNQVFKNKQNQYLQYQMYMAQQLQYFSVTSNIAVFDPVIRKKIFDLSHQVYIGQDIILGVGRQIKIVPGKTVSELIQLTDIQIYNEEIDYKNLYLALTRPFGYGQVTRNLPIDYDNGDKKYRYPNIDDQDRYINPLEAMSPIIYYLTNKGLYEQIPEDFTTKQPRVPIPVILQLTEDQKLRNILIDECDKVNMELVENGVLRCNKSSIEQLLSILDTHVLGKQLRTYLSMCVQIQYHNNYKFMRKCMKERHQKLGNVELHTSIELEKEKMKFIDMAKKVINIKQLGNAALIVLSDIINNSINEQVNQFKNSSKINYKSIMSELNNLILIYREQTSRDNGLYFEDMKEDIQILTKNNNYLNNYVHNRKKPMNFFEGKYSMVGGLDKVKNNSFQEYFDALERYIIRIKQMVHKMPIVENFASLFTLIANNEGSKSQLDKDSIIRYIQEYMVSSMIDISESVIDLDFDVSLSPITSVPINERIRVKHTQLIVDRRENKSLKLISPDCIFIPYYVNSSEFGGVVPQFNSQISRDFDQLFNQLVNAMSQRMLNHIGMYRFSQKKVIDQTVQISRLMFGVGKGKKRSKSGENSYKQLLSEQSNKNKLMLVDRDSKMSMNKYELYFRSYFLIKYYIQLFDEINDELRKQYGDKSQYFIYYFKPDLSEPEGLLFQITQYVNQKPMLLEDLKKFIETVDRIYSKYNLANNDQLYQKIVTYVNQSFGIISNIDTEQIDTMKDVQKMSTNTITLREFLSGIDQPIQRTQLGDPRLASLNNLISNEDNSQNPVYTNISQIIQKTLGKLHQIIEYKQGSKLDLNSISKYIRNQYKLLSIQNATDQEYFDNLLYIINNIHDNFMNDIQTPILFHEQALLAITLHNNIQIAIQVKNELDSINPHEQLLYTHPDYTLPDPESEAIEKNNTHVINQFINKIADQYSLIPDPNLVEYQFSIKDLQPAYYVNNQPEIIPDTLDTRQVISQYFHVFRDLIVIQSQDKLQQKLKQLKSIISSLMHNPKFDDHRDKLYRMNEDNFMNKPDLADIFDRDSTTRKRNQKTRSSAIQEFILSGRGYTLEIDDKHDDYQKIVKNVKESINKGNAQIYKNGPNFTQHGFMVGVQKNRFGEVSTSSLPGLSGLPKNPDTKSTDEFDIRIIVSDLAKKYRDYSKLVVSKDPTGIVQFDTLKVDCYVQIGSLDIQTQADNSISTQNAVQNSLQNFDSSHKRLNKSDDLRFIYTDYDKFGYQTLDVIIDLIILDRKTQYENLYKEIMNGKLVVIAITVNAVTTRKRSSILLVDSKDIIMTRLGIDLNSTAAELLQKLTDDIRTMAGEGVSGTGLGIKNNDIVCRDPDPAVAVDQPEPEKLNLQRDFYYNYYIYEGQLQQTDEVFVFNRLLKEFFISCRPLSGHQDLIAQMFIQSLGEYKSTMQLYGMVHGREVFPSQVQENISLYKRSRELVQDTRREAAIPAGEDLYTNARIQNPMFSKGIQYDEMVNNVLYDGYRDQKDLFTFLDIEIHNENQFRDNLQTLSVFTSSIYNFFISWQQQQDLNKLHVTDLLTQLNIKFNNEDLQILVSNCVFTKMKMQCLLEKVVFKQKLLQQVCQKIFQNKQQQKWNIDNSPDMKLRQQLTQKSQFLSRLQNVIQHKILPALDVVIDNKNNVLPPILQSGISGVNQSPLMSNLTYLMNIKKQLETIHMGNIQDDDITFKLSFSRYVYGIVSKQNMEQFIRQSGQQKYQQFDPVLKFTDLIQLAIKHRYALQNTILNGESQYSRAILLIPTPRILVCNPEQYRNIVIPIQMSVMFDGTDRTMSASIQKYHKYLCDNQMTLNKLGITTFNRALQVVERSEIIVDRFTADRRQSEIYYANFFERRIQKPLFDRDCKNQYIQLFPYVYDRRRHLNQQKQTIREIYGVVELKVDGVVVNELDNQMCTYAGIDWDESVDDYSLKLPVRVNNYMYLLWQDKQNYTIVQSNPANNPKIFEEIVRYLQDTTYSNNIELRNLIELGIIPLNLQMLKREAGLINLSLYSNAFQQYLDRIQQQKEVAIYAPNAKPIGAVYHKLFDATRLDLGLHRIVNQIDMDTGEPEYMNKMRIPEFQILKNILMNTRSIPDDGISLKFDHIQQSMQFRVALFLYLILKEMLGGIVHRDRDVYLYGIEGLISGQFDQPTVSIYPPGHHISGPYRMI